MKRLTHILLLVALVLASLACRAQAAPEKVKVGLSPALSSAGLFLAKERGYFTQEGLDVEIVEFPGSGPELLPALASGQIDVGAGNISARMYNAMTRGIQLRIVADKGSNLPGCGYLAVVVRKGLDHVRGPADLKGLKFALTGPGVSQEVVLDRYLAKGGLSISDVKVVTMSYQDASAALLTGAVDGTVQIEPLLTDLVTRGEARVLASADAIDAGQQSAVILYSESFATKRRAAAEAFMVAYLRGVRDYRAAFVTRQVKGAALDGVIAQMAKYLPIKDTSMFRRMKPVGLNPDGYVNAKSMRADLLWYNQHGYVKEMPELRRFIDDSYVRAALKRLQK